MGSQSSATPLIHRKQVYFEFQRQCDRFSFTQINLILVTLKFDDTLGVSDRLSLNSGERLNFNCTRNSFTNRYHFVVDSTRNHNRCIRLAQQI